MMERNRVEERTEEYEIGKESSWAIWALTRDETDADPIGLANLSNDFKFELKFQKDFKALNNSRPCSYLYDQ